jgi:hypothetical protein
MRFSGIPFPIQVFRNLRGCWTYRILSQLIPFRGILGTPVASVCSGSGLIRRVDPSLLFNLSCITLPDLYYIYS